MCESGEVHVLAGANGAGKSTLIRVLSGVFGDYGGEVFVGGVSTAAAQRRRRPGPASRPFTRSCRWSERCASPTT